MRHRSLWMLLLLVFACAFVCLPALAQDDEMMWPPRSVGMRELVNAQFVGAFDMSREYSFQREVPNTLVESFSHSLDAQAPDGGSRIFDFMHVVPFTQGSHFWTSTHLGFDQLGTSGTLTANEATAAGG